MNTLPELVPDVVPELYVRPEQLRTTIQDTLNKAFAKQGLTAQVATTPHDYFVVTVEQKGASEKRFKTFAKTFGLKPEWFGQTFTFKGTTYRITGWDLGRTRYKVQAVRTFDNRGTSFTPDHIQELFKTKQTKAA